MDEREARVMAALQAIVSLESIRMLYADEIYDIGAAVVDALFPIDPLTNEASRHAC
jgi:hypothetical protein